MPPKRNPLGLHGTSSQVLYTLFDTGILPTDRERTGFIYVAPAWSRKLETWYSKSGLDVMKFSNFSSFSSAYSKAEDYAMMNEDYRGMVSILINSGIKSEYANSLAMLIQFGDEPKPKSIRIPTWLPEDQRALFEIVYEQLLDIAYVGNRLSAMHNTEPRGVIIGINSKVLDDLKIIPDPDLADSLIIECNSGLDAKYIEGIKTLNVNGKKLIEQYFNLRRK
jgi:hypothetical protein